MEPYVRVNETEKELSLVIGHENEATWNLNEVVYLKQRRGGYISHSVVNQMVRMAYAAGQCNASEQLVEIKNILKD